jgi:DeoR family suf operon transcriptional repressor
MRSIVMDFIVKASSDNGKSSTRDIILDAIKQANEATVDELAEAADVSPVTVRHHLNSLQADGLLRTRSVRRKVGRPYYVYSLSDKGHELFPQRYMRLSNMLLSELKARFSADVVNEMFSDVVNRVAARHQGKLAGLTFEERLDYLIELLAAEGFLASWEASNGGYLLSEYSCPYYSVGQKHSEVCFFDRQLIRIMLDTEITQTSCMLQGDPACNFSVQAPARKLN